MRRLLLFLLLVLQAQAATNQLTSADRDTVNTAIQNAVNGDTIRLPANQSVTWTSALNSFTKGITLDFNGCTITRNIPSLNGPILTATAVAGFTTRITGGTFQGGTNVTVPLAFNPRYFTINSVSGGPMRVDNCVFQPSGVQSLSTSHTAGQLLVDHCTFYAGNPSSFDPDEIIHQNGYGQGNLAGWDNDVIEGDPSYNAAYFEDNTFIWLGSIPPGGNAAIQTYYGSRTVFRHNDLYNTLVDVHGDNTPHSGRWWEFYENDFYVSMNNSQLFQLRGGSGVVFNNRLHKQAGSQSSGYVMKTFNENTGNPAPCQIGRGKNETPGNHSNQASVPAYIWNNTVIQEGGPAGGFGFSPEIHPTFQGSLAQTPRDYILNVDKRTITPNPYTPAPYPHPLAGGAPPVETVAQPVISPAAGSYYSTQTISMQTPTSGASYYYTLDGSDPASSGTRTLYTASFSLSSDAIVRAIGIKSGVPNSPISSSTFDFSPWSVTGTTWQTFAVPQQTGSFTASFRVRTNSAVSDSVVGLGAAPIAANANLEANLLFSINGVVQVRDGGTYVGTYPYQANTDYDISMVIDPSVSTNQIQSVSITPAGGSTTVLGTDFDFRNGSTATELDNFGFRAGSAPVTVTVSNLTLTPAPTPAGTYYVSKDTGNNANVGSLASPWATIEYALGQISGGDTIIVREATTAYTLSGSTLVITGDSGTPTQYTTLKAYPGERPAIEGQGNTGRIAFGTLPPAAPVETSYWRIEGFEISNFNHCLTIRNGAHHIEVVGNFLHHSGNQLLHAYQNVHDILIENNTFEDGGAIGTGNGEAFYIGTDQGGSDNTYNITIKENTIDRMEHEGIDIKHNVLNVLIEDNVISNCVVNFEFGKWSILVNPSTIGNPGHIIRRNFISGQGGVTEAAAIGVATGAQVYNNVVFNVADPAYAVSIIGGDAHTRYLWNNTLDIASSKAIFFSGGTSSVGNNIGPPTASSNRAFNSADFVNASIHDYRLVAGIAGATPPFTISKDFDQVDRGVPPDIGAYEFTGVAPDTSAPLPNPSTFEIAPAATGPNAITMTATEATDSTSPPVQYYFEETTGGLGATDSGWQPERVYTDSGLSPNTAYSYFVWTRDALLNQGAASGTASATTPPAATVSGNAVDCETLNVTTLRVGP